MEEADRYRRSADHCDAMAAQMKTADQRHAYLEMATMWRKLARQIEEHRRIMALRGGGPPLEAKILPFKRGDEG